MKICAVIVTFNRKLDLMNCIPALLSQTTTLDSILIVDNCSTDGTYEELVTGEYLKSNANSNMLKCEKGQVKLNYFRMPANTGGAGGFNKGQELALKTDCDWIWLMDDDGFPAPNCLELLLESAIKNNLKVINPIVRNVNKPELLSFDLGGIRSVSEAYDTADNNDLLMGLANPFNGTLFKSTVIVKIGLIKKEMFIWGDEQEYLLRINSYNINYATHTKANFYHPEGKTTFSTFLLRFKIANKPEKLEMNYYRNIGYIDRTYNNKLALKFLIIYILFFISKGQFVKSVRFIRYYFDGWFDKYRLGNIL